MRLILGRILLCNNEYREYLNKALLIRMLKFTDKLTCVFLTINKEETQLKKGNRYYENSTKLH